MIPALIFQYAVLIFLGLAGLIVAIVNLTRYIDLFEDKDNEKN